MTPFARRSDARLAPLMKDRRAERRRDDAPERMAGRGARTRRRRDEGRRGASTRSWPPWARGGPAWLGRLADFTTRWQYLVPTATGLVIAFVRVNVPGEGPRASVKVVRWSRVQVGELAMETQGGHRLLSFSVEGIILKGADADADRVAAFALVLLGAIDGRVSDFEKALTKNRRRSSTLGGPGTGGGDLDQVAGKGGCRNVGRVEAEGVHGEAGRCYVRRGGHRDVVEGARVQVAHDPPRRRSRPAPDADRPREP